MNVKGFYNSTMEEFMFFNPTESIKKGHIAKKISMERLSPFARKINGFEVAAYTSGPKFRNGDTLLAKITPCLENGKTAFVDVLDDNEVAFGSSEFIVLREKQDISDKEFVYYLAKSPAFRERAISCMEGTSGRKRVNDKTLKQQILPVPDIATQRRIAALLSSLDAKIALNNRINDNLEQMAKAVFEQLKIMNYELREKKLQEIIAENKTGDWGKESEQGNYTKKVTCIRGTDINSMLFGTENKAPERFILDKNSHKILQNGDFIIEISGGSPTQSTGRMVCITDDLLASYENLLICSNFCKAISLIDENLFYYFYFQWQNWYDSGLFFGYEGKTSGLKNFLFENFANSQQIAIPPQEVLHNFNTTIKPLFSMIIKNKRESEQLSKLRDYLLPLLMNGQVSVNYHLYDC
ncbi:MAG: restriction endonuclease subunit S [Bacteroidales bacterium]|jgi:type I restriction enzyme S subunit|nr:restriction endonuclease subunit S [Bacteroidales bacterium]